MPHNRNPEEIVLKITATRETTVEGFVLQDRFHRNMQLLSLWKPQLGPTQAQACIADFPLVFIEETFP